MTDVEWPDVRRSITSFSTFLPPNTSVDDEDIENNNGVTNAPNYKPQLPPKKRQQQHQQDNHILMDPSVTSSTDKLTPPLVPLRTVFPKTLKSVENGSETVAISKKVPTKMIPVDLKPVTSIFDNIDDDCDKPVFLKSPHLNGDLNTKCELQPASEERNQIDSSNDVIEPTENGGLSEDYNDDVGDSNTSEVQDIVFMSIIEMQDDDKRFGFSLIGGSDEGFGPRIDTINPGSPADKADLEVGDEILEVNGKTLEDATHTEVISHIHQCIRSRTVSLRVKRKGGNKLALDLAQTCKVQDAFVIAVEQKAQDRLEKLSALRKVKPVDMTKLSQELNNSTSPENGIIESNSIYVASVPELSHNSKHRIKGQINGFRNTDDDGLVNDITPVESLHNTEEEIELKQDILDNVKSDNYNGTQLFEAINNNTQFSSAQKDSDNMMENRPHREMAVDVPESFVATAKQSPRYPPPRQNGTTPRNHPGSNYSSDRSSRASRDMKETHAPQSSIDSSGSSNFKKPVVSPKPKFNDNVTVKVNGGPVIDPNNAQDPAQLDRIRKYQEDIKKRKEEEDRIAREEEFLRSSLRGSKKLQALESYPAPSPPTGVINTAFQADDVDEHDAQPDRIALPQLTQSEPIGPEDLQDALQRVQIKLTSNGYHDDLTKVNNLLNNPEFQKSLLIHKKVQEIWCFNKPPTPLCTDAQDLVQEVLNIIHESSQFESLELVQLLNKFDFEALILAHDKIAERDMVSEPQIGADEDILDRASQYTDDSIKIVRIDKTNEPLGATVRNEGDAVIIGRIVKGGAAEKSGLLHEGDEILEVNSIEMRGKSVNDVCDILATMMGTLTFIIIPSQIEKPQIQARDTVMHVKAHFDYEPDDDLYNPCRELGISFQKGDILHVINQEDANWWQAYREGEEDQTLAGLIPSKNFQHQREAMKQTIVGDNNNKEEAKKAKFLCARKAHRKKKKKVMYNAHYNEDTDCEEILTYEEVALYYPRANRKRPVVLIGPPNIGRHELRQKLMEDVERFAAAIPHTSRFKKDGEMDGQDYHFITRSQFESDIVSRKFVEHGEFEKNYYGTSLDAIRSVVNLSKICVLNLHPQSLKILKNSDLKPYVVFVAPPSLEKLRLNRVKMGANVKDDELKDIIEKAREMEDNYGHYFDMIIINSDINKAYNELLKEINILEREPQWVPAVWLHDEIN